VPPDLALGRDVLGGRYTLVRVLGEGAQGATYEARDNGPGAARPEPGRLAADFERYVKRAREGEVSPQVRGLVAVKCFRLDRAKAWKDVELAEREATTLAALTHPRLPRYITHFEEDGALYLVMEKIEGESLAALRARGGSLAPGEVTRMILELGEALRYLHGRAPPVVHRDIKPGNVIRREDGSFTLVDFGAVRDRLKPAGGSTVVGTFGFMAPEQFQGRASAKSDVYGLGATALAMLTGREPEELPHRGLGIDVDGAVPEGTPRTLVKALRAMLAPDPDERAGSIDEVLRLFANANANADAKKSDADAPTRPKREARDRARERDDARGTRAERRAARKARRAAARARAMPVLPRLFAQLGLSVAILAVWAAVGVVTPLVLWTLSLALGAPLRRAAKACEAASTRSIARMKGVSRWVAGEREAAPGGIGDADTDVARIRVEEMHDGAVRVGDASADASADADANPTEREGEDVPDAKRARRRR
jgi:hypothetical protein